MDAKDSGLSVSSNASVVAEEMTLHADTMMRCTSDHGTRGTAIAVWSWAESDGSWHGNGG